MTPQMIDELLAGGIILGGLMIILAIGGFIADYVFPHIPFIQRWLDSLPDYEDDEDEQYIPEYRAGQPKAEKWRR